MGAHLLAAVADRAARARGGVDIGGKTGKADLFAARGADDGFVERMWDFYPGW